LRRVKNLWKTRLVKASAVSDVIGAGRAVLNFLTILLSFGTLGDLFFVDLYFFDLYFIDRFHRSFFRPRL
jgi:hypothetical protein